ncbi:MAG: hypothetical protein HQM06_02260 [Magnetococcales bacterium]|nr:hypothetical protein [Magnetococcales bacterium]
MKPHQTLLAILLLTLLALLYGHTFLPGHDWGDDFALYIHHAKNMLSGIPYHDTHYIYNPEMSKTGPPAYPPGFPVLLMPVYALFGFSLPALKWWVTSFLLLALGTLFWTFQSQLTFNCRLALVAIVGCNGLFLQVKDEIISDLPFLFFVLLTLGYLHRQACPVNGSTLRVALVQALLIYACYAIRMAGIVFIPALLWKDWLQHRTISPLSWLTLLFFAALLLLQQHTFPGGEGYLTSLLQDFQLAQMPEKLFQNFNYFTLIWGNEKWLRVLLFLGTGTAMLLAFQRRWRQQVSIIETFFIGYFLLILLWPYTGVRFALPLIPLYLFYVILWLQSLPVIRLYQRTASPLTLFLMVVAALYGLQFYQWSKDGYWSQDRDGIHQPYAKELFHFIRQKTAPDAVILFIKPRVLALLTGRKSATFSAQQPEKLWHFIQQTHASYLIDAFLEGGPATPGLQAFIQHHAARLMPVFASGPVVVYRIISPTSPGANFPDPIP